MSSGKSEKNNSELLCEKVTCPHCWKSSPVEDILWIAEAPELTGDARLGEADKQRFLPARFDIKGNALDLKGFACKKLACPHCHLEIPRSYLEMEPFFISIVGAPASGKSCFLTSMCWNLRKILPNEFDLNFLDADPEMNGHLQEDETAQFLNDDPDAITRIKKTEAEGDMYKTVMINDQYITYLQPYLFTLSPAQEHFNAAERNRVSRTLTIYDNAGESYLPIRDGDAASLPVTRHLEQSNCIMFTFDPIQDNRFRAVCTNPSNDPQLIKETSDSFLKSPLRQEMVLGEMINRTRSYIGLHSSEKYDRPVIIVVTKFDAWKDLVPDLSMRNPWAKTISSNTPAFLLKKVQDVSKTIRELLKKHLPEMVGMLDQFADNVTYIPVSATGGPPIQDPKTGNWGFKANSIKPIWVEVPLLYALSQAADGLVCVSKK
ncbi:MAG: hypothetical protein Q4G69_02725 [Planctomycetia bacterium]|nr:hypothetical protein [Planctomycetia bacterium]